jgi:glutaredoxin 3
MSTSVKPRVTPTVAAMILGVFVMGTFYLRGRPALTAHAGEPMSGEPRSGEPISGEPKSGEQIAAEAPPRTAPPPAYVEQAPPADRPDRAEHDRRVTEAMRTVDITTYGAVWCPSCKAAHKWLDAQGIAYVDKDIEKNRDANRAMRALNPAGTIPTIDIEGQVLIGFDARAIEHAIRTAAEKRVP